MEQWGDVGQVFDGNGDARLPKSVDDSGNLERVPYQDGVGYQAQAASRGALRRSDRGAPMSRCTKLGDWRSPASEGVS
jgi:hypothetical protein